MTTKLALATTILSGALLAATAMPAQADIINYDGFYLSGFGGYNYLTGNESQPYAAGAPVGVNSEIEFDHGFIGGAAAGYSWGNGLRTEVEYAYRNNSVKDVDPNVPGVDGGEITLHTVLVNAIYDLPVEWVVRPYAGLGAGLGMAKYENIFDLGGFTIDDDATSLAYQVLAGLSLPMGSRFSANLEYRWLNTQENELQTNFAGVKSDLGYTSHNVLLGLRYMFGDPVVYQRTAPASAPAPIAAAAPAAAPMPIMAAAAPVAAGVPVVPQTYIVFFDFDKAELTPEAQRVLVRAAQDIRVGQGARIHVIGHTDRAGSSRYNQRLSERRAKVVKDELVVLGVADDQITSRAVGESQPRIPTADGVREAQNRRAEIIFQ